nr:acidic leucine-rich nuclear phosphoprotein 32 family member B-like [Aegilops tauschii subsp. strangulata]
MDEDEEDDEEGVDEDDEEGMEEDEEGDEEGVDENNEEGVDEDDEDDEEDEAYVESNRRFLREEQAKTDVLFDKLDAEQEAEANDADVRMEIVDISDDGE